MGKPQKMPLKWHEDCLRNMLDGLHAKCAQAASLEAEIERLNADIMHLQAQLAEAKQRKLDGFDGERFMKGSK